MAVETTGGSNPNKRRAPPGGNGNGNGKPTAKMKPVLEALAAAANGDLSARVPEGAPTEEELWPSTRESGVGTEWVSAVVDRAAAGPYPPLGQLLGDHRRESRMPVELRFTDIND